MIKKLLSAIKKPKFWTILLAVLFLVYAFHDINFIAMWKSIQHANYYFITIAIVLGAIPYYLRSLRWKLIIDASQRVSFNNILKYYMIGFFTNNILPLRMGEGIRIFLVNRKEKVPVMSLIGTCVMERFLDGLSLLAMMFILSYFHGAFPKVLIVLARIVIGLIIAILALYLIIKHDKFKLRHLIKKFLKKVLPEKAYEKIASGYRNFSEGFKMLHNFRSFSLSTVVTFAVWVVEFFQCYLLFYAFYLVPDKISNPILAGFVPLLYINLGSMVPSGPGDVGLFQFFGRLALVTTLKIEPSLALSYVMLFHISYLLPPFIFGTIALWKEKLNVHDIRKIADEEKEMEENLIHPKKK